MPEHNLATVEESFRRLTQECSRIRGFFDSLISTKAEDIIAIEDSREILETQHEVQDALKSLHQQSVERTRILYEDVLTGLVKDIFPNDPENNRVHLNLYVKRNKAALDVEVSNIYGHRRDVFLDKGGSVKSIIAIGLRFIALSRTNRRRFIAFDEADKELNPVFIPRFAKMMAQLASKIGMQVIYISHHNYQDFEGHARIIKLSRKNGKVVSDIISDNAPTEISGWEGEEHIGALMEGVGITDLSLMNVKQHQNTIIELSPLVNVIIGSNDIGKSTIVQALECVARNKGRLGLIRDEQDKMRVEIGLEGNSKLVYQYKRRGSRKTKYQLYNHQNVVVKESREGNQCPDWLHGVLGMETYKNQDLHIALQGASNFMLDVNVSEHKRAEILSLNKLCGRTQQMIERHNELVDHHKKITSEARKRLAKTKQKLEIIQSLNEFDEAIKVIGHDIEKLKHRQSRLERMKALIEQWGPCQRRIEEFGPIIKLSEPVQLIDLEKANRVVRMDRLIQDITRLARITKIEREALDKLGDMPELPDVSGRLDGILALGKKWGKLNARISLYQKALSDLEALPVGPEIKIDNRKKELIESLQKLEKIVQSDKVSLDKEKNKLKQYQDQLSELRGQACPVCSQPMDFSGGHSHGV